MLLLLNVVGLVGIAALVWCWRMVGRENKISGYWEDATMDYLNRMIDARKLCERLKKDNAALKQDRDNLGRDKCNLTADCEALCEQVTGLSDDLALSNAKYDCVCEVLNKVNKSKSKKCACKSKGKK